MGSQNFQFDRFSMIDNIDKEKDSTYFCDTFASISWVDRSDVMHVYQRSAVKT